MCKPKTLVATIPGMISERDLEPVRAVSDVTYFETEPMEESELAAHCDGFDYLMLNMDVLTTKKGAKLTREFYTHPKTQLLRSIAVDMTGMDYFSPSEAAARNLTLQNIPHYSSQSVAESILAEVLAHSRQRHLAYMDEIRGRDVIPRKGINLRGRTAGIIGLGSIGIHVAFLLNGFGMKVVGWSRNPKPIVKNPHPGTEQPEIAIDHVPLPELFAQSRVIVVAMKTVSEGASANVGLIGSDLLSRASNAIVVNLANPLLVDSAAMNIALASGKVAAYSVESESRNQFQGFDQVHFAPSNAWNSDESMATLRATWVSNAVSAINGNPQNAYSD